MDADEEEINAGYGYMKSHKMNASYGKMNASYKKESVNEKSKLKAGKGKITVDLNWDGSAADKKFAETKYKIKLKITRTGALATGEKARVLAYVSGQDYAMDDEDIEDLMPEILEGHNSPKTLSIIRLGEFSGDADTVRKKRWRFEDTVMCEHCGKMHEEGACGIEASKDKSKELDPETSGMEEAKKIKLSSSDMMKISKIADKNSGDMEKAIKLIDKMKKGASEHPDVMAILKLANEDVKEAVDVDRRTVGFKAAMVRNEKAKIKREKAKAKKAAKKDQAELDARYDYDGGVDDVLASANAAIFGTKLETAANAVAHGGVDMAPNAGKKKKDKEKIFARKY